MSSGIYSAMSGAVARMNRLDTISDNISNSRTAGFKGGQNVFEGILERTQTGIETRGINLTEVRQGFTDFSQGALTPTGVGTHLAIEGEGFFRVRGMAGEDFYTRQGNFHLNGLGQLVNADGLNVLDDGGQPIVLPSPDVEIDERGRVNAGGGDFRQIAVVAFADQAGLERRGDGLFALNGNAPAPQAVAAPVVHQGKIEEANINMMAEMVRMVEANRAFEACQRMMKTFDDLSSKANEIGLLG